VSAAPASRIGAQLYQLLPEVYRSRDKSGDLARYLDGAGELLDAVHATLAQRLDDHFPDTCQDWLLPYFAELLDVAMRSPEPAGQRAEVSNAIAWRQRKGTAACTEEIAEAVGLMEAELQEAWRRVARTPRVGETREAAALDLRAVTLDLRRHSRAQRVAARGLATRATRYPGVAGKVLWEQANPQGVPCFPGSYEDCSMRTPDLRTPDWRRGHFHPKRLLAFVPVPEGFFPHGAPSFAWDELAQAKADGLIEEIETAGRTLYRRPASQPKTVRIRGAIRLGDAGPPEHVYRFEGFHLRNTLTVAQGRLEIARCAAFKLKVHKADVDAPVLTATDCLLRHVQAARGLAQLECCTVLGKTICEAIQAIDSLFLGNLQRDLHQPEEAPHIECLSHVRVPRELLAAVLEGERARIQRATTDIPVFFRLGFGEPGAGVLHPATPRSIRAGAEEGGELGAYHHLHLELRWQAVRDKLAEFLPFGLEAVLIPDARLGCVPPR
jgi:hypothetical protein